MLYLHYNDSIAELRSMVETDAFEQLLKEMLVDKDGLCKLHVLPSENHGALLRQAENDRLSAEKAAMTEEEVQQIAGTFAAFTAWQQKPDTAEGLASLPKLALSEINPEPVLMATQEDACQGVTVLRHKANCNGIVNISGYFRLTDRSLEELTQLSLLPKLLGNLPTAKRTADQLQNELKAWLGDLSFGIDCVSKLGQTEQCTPMLTFHCSVLQENLAKAEELIYEILTSTDFSQHDRIKEILLQTETEQQQRGMMAGHMLAFKTALAHFSAGSAVQEATSGITYTQWLHSLSKNFDAQIGAFTALAHFSLSAAVCRSRLVLGITEEGHTDPSAFLAMLPQGEAAPEKASYQTKLPKKLGIRIPAQVSYAATGFHLSQLGMQYDGSAHLLSSILSLAHLWNEIRVQGGAYGAGMRMSMGGGMFSYSYRDPSPARSLEVYRNMGNFVRKFAQSGEDITGFIISSVAETEPLASPDQLGAGADRDWFTGFTLEQAKAERQQMLQSTAADLEKWCVALDSLREQGSVCVVGYADALAACEAENLTVIDI
jgi:Zn-dependent M16 (insulinase) family peptidase